VLPLNLPARLAGCGEAWEVKRLKARIKKCGDLEFLALCRW
jgi:hypothetical protein